jgi:hypothetical protein
MPLPPARVRSGTTAATAGRTATIAITGSAELANHPEAVWSAFLGAISELRDRLPADPPYRFLHGDAVGVDRLIAARLLETGREVVAIPADWATHGREAGWLRNKELVAQADGLVAIWDGYSSGSLHATSLAAVRGIPWVCRIISTHNGDVQAGSGSAQRPRHLDPWDETDPEFRPPANPPRAGWHAA